VKVITIYHKKATPTQLARSMIIQIELTLLQLTRNV